jgi:carbonic anhydrase
MAQHTCEAVVVHCIDFRIQGKVNELMEQRFPGSFDRVAVAGGVKNLEFVTEQVQLSVRLHEPKHIVLVQHEDCGAYGGSAAFENLEAERAFQTSEIEKASQLIQQQFPSLEVHKSICEVSHL